MFTIFEVYVAVRGRTKLLPLFLVRVVHHVWRSLAQ